MPGNSTVSLRSPPHMRIAFMLCGTYKQKLCYFSLKILTLFSVTIVESVNNMSYTKLAWKFYFT